MSTPLDAAELKLDAARAKLAKQEAHVETARQAVADAEAELEEAQAASPEPVRKHSGAVTKAKAGHAKGTGKTGLA